MHWNKIDKRTIFEVPISHRKYHQHQQHHVFHFSWSTLLSLHIITIDHCHHYHHCEFCSWSQCWSWILLTHMRTHCLVLFLENMLLFVMLYIFFVGMPWWNLFRWCCCTGCASEPLFFYSNTLAMRTLRWRCCLIDRACWMRNSRRIWGVDYATKLCLINWFWCSIFFFAGLVSSWFATWIFDISLIFLQTKVPNENPPNT